MGSPEQANRNYQKCLMSNIGAIFAADFLSVYVRIPSTINQEIFDIQKIYDSRDDAIFPLETIKQAICGQ